MMGRGEVVVDIRGEEKKNLTVDKLIDLFSQIRKREFTNDEALLAGRT